MKVSARVRAALREYLHKLAVERGGKGGVARAKNMSAAKRSASARKAARARWAKRASS